MQCRVLFGSLLPSECQAIGVARAAPQRACRNHQHGRAHCPLSTAFACFAQGHSSECFDAFARAHISAEKDASATLPGPAPPAAPPAPRHALAEDTVDRLRDMAEAWGDGGGQPGAAGGGDGETSLAALPVDARRSFLRDVAAGRVKPPRDDGTADALAGGEWCGWWERDGTERHHPAVAAALDAGRRRAHADASSFGGTHTMVSEVAPRRAHGEAASLGPGADLPAAIPLADLARAAHGTTEPRPGPAQDAKGPGTLASLPWAAGRALAAADAGRLPAAASLLRRGMPSPSLVGAAAEAAFATVFVWRLYAGDPAGADAAGSCELLGTLAPSLLPPHSAETGGAAVGRGGGATTPAPAAKEAEAATGAEAVLVRLSAAAAAAIRAAATGTAPAARALLDTAGVAASRRLLVETLARAAELLAASAAGAMAELAVSSRSAHGGSRARASDGEDAAAPSSEDQLADALALRLQKRLALPGMPVEPLQWRAAASEAVRTGRATHRPLAGREIRSSLQAIKRVSAAYRKLWFLLVVAADAPDGWLKAIGDGASAAHARATEDGGWAAPRHGHGTTEALTAAARAAGVPVGAAAAARGPAGRAVSVDSALSASPSGAASEPDAAGAVVRSAIPSRVAAARAELARLRLAPRGSADAGKPSRELEEMD